MDEWNLAFHPPVFRSLACSVSYGDWAGRLCLLPKLVYFRSINKLSAMLSYPVRIALIAALGGFLFGFETVVISGAEKTLEAFWHLSSFAHGFTIASSLIGTVLGSLFAGAPAKR